MEAISHGHRINYLIAGEGEPLVLMSGHMQAAQDWVDEGYAKLLSDRFRLLMIDPLGYGDSDKPHAASEYSLSARADHVDAVLDAEAVDAAHLWGYSYGSQIAEAFARLRPRRTRSIVLGGTFPGLKGADRRNLYEPGLDVYRSGDWDRIWREFMPYVPDAGRERFQARNDLLACAASLEGGFEPLDVESDPLPLPMLCYVGTEEWFWEGARDVTAAAGGRFFPVDGADHAVSFTRAEEVVTEVRGFLDA